MNDDQMDIKSVYASWNLQYYLNLIAVLDTSVFSNSLTKGEVEKVLLRIWEEYRLSPSYKKGSEIR